MTNRPDNIVLSRDGDLRAGIFYELIVSDDELFLELEGKHTDDYISAPLMPTSDELFLDGRSYLKANWKTDRGVEQRRECPLHRSHVTARYWKDVTVRLSRGPDVPPLILLDADATRSILVSSTLAEALRKTEFTGMRLRSVRVDPESTHRPDRAGKPLALFELQFLGRKCFRPLSVVHAPNQCPWCGKAPLICEGCGYRDLFCCGKRHWIGRASHKGESDRRLIAAGFEKWRPAIIEASVWDGSDFIFGGIDQGLRDHVVSRRVVNWLLSVHAAPFYARPVLVDVAGADDDTLTQLQLMSGVGHGETTR